jgi:hypothetical protein
MRKAIHLAWNQGGIISFLVLKVTVGWLPPNSQKDQQCILVGFDPNNYFASGEKTQFLKRLSVLRTVPRPRFHECPRYLTLFDCLWVFILLKAHVLCFSFKEFPDVRLNVHQVQLVRFDEFSDSFGAQNAFRFEFDECSGQCWQVLWRRFGWFLSTINSCSLYQDVDWSLFQLR